jgi:hypothetical protein
MAEHDFILLGVALALTGVLYLLSWKRNRAHPPDSQWQGHGIDVTEISNRVHRLRHDYLGELPSRLRCSGRRARLVALARRLVGGLPYFRRRAARCSAPQKWETDSHGV